MRRSRVAVVVAIAPALLFSACERRVEEPSPLPRPVAETIERKPPPAPTVTPPAGASTDGRCVKALPPSPARPIAPKPAAGCPKEPKRPDLGAASVTVIGASASAPAKVSVEVAAKDKDRQRGLMYRTSMADDKGMLFVFETREEHSFWMHNTCIPLDMIFIDHDGLIVGIEENTPTLSDDTFTVGCASKYVLEVNAGWSRANGVKPGQWVKIEGL